MLITIAGKQHPAIELLGQIKDVGHCLAAHQARLVDQQELSGDLALQLLILEQGRNRFGIFKARIAKRSPTGIS